MITRGDVTAVLGRGAIVNRLVYMCVSMVYNSKYKFTSPASKATGMFVSRALDKQTP